jgi:hypothetical protein
MDRSRIRLATQLLLKAESTDADPEAAALVERSYRLLAEVITQHDLEQGHPVSGPRRRERRFLRDRRADRRGKPVPEPVVPPRAPGAAGPGVDSAARYRRSDGPAGGARAVDLEL